MGVLSNSQHVAQICEVERNPSGNAVSWRAKIPASEALNAAVGGVDLQLQDGRLTRASVCRENDGDYEIASRDHPMKLSFRANETAHVVLRADRLVRT